VGNVKHKKITQSARSYRSPTNGTVVSYRLLLLFPSSSSQQRDAATAAVHTVTRYRINVLLFIGIGFIMYAQVENRRPDTIQSTIRVMGRSAFRRYPWPINTNRPQQRNIRRRRRPRYCIEVLATYSTETHHANGSRGKSTRGNGMVVESGHGNPSSSILLHPLHCTVKP